MKKIDIAIQSFKKPELLLYTLLSLKQYEQDSIDEVWIQDDSGDNQETIRFYETKSFIDALHPWKINVRSNTQRGGWWFTPVKGLYPNYLSLSKRFLFSLRAKYRGTGFQLDRENSRYQWAIDNTKKRHLLIIHDDIVFYKPFIQEIVTQFLENEQLAIVGDLGQCWRCEYQHKGCTPQKVVQGFRPSQSWPDIEPSMKGHRWPCRINEWCAVINVDVAREIESKYQVLYGNMDNSGDTSAFWFSLINKEHYKFNDIAFSKEEKSKIFLHADGGSGHSVWVDQGNGKKMYDSAHILNQIKTDFDVEIKF